MTVRTSEKTVTFRRPFRLGDFDEVLQPGAYRIETDEELLAGISFPAYRRILTLMHLHAEPGRRGVERLLTIDPKELDEALERDQAPAEVPVGRGAHRETLIRAVQQREKQIDCWAVDRAEDEGMTVCLG
jgi:hypothetical protein